MAHIYRKKYTRTNAQGERITKVRKKWYIRYVDPLKGRRVSIAGYSDRKATEQKAAFLERQAERRASGLIDPAEVHWNRPIEDHLQEYRDYLINKGASEEHAKRTLNRATLILNACKIERINQITLAPIQAHVAQLRSRKALVTIPENQEQFTKKEIAVLFGIGIAAVGKQIKHCNLPADGNGKARRFPRETVLTLATMRAEGRSIATANHYLQSIRGFCRWLVMDRRLTSNPISGIKAGNTNLDCRRSRRVLTHQELALLLDRTRTSKRVINAFDGPTRCMLYSLALSTGFRAHELSSLRKADIHWGDNFASVRCHAAYTKNRKHVEQPLPPWIIPLLEQFLQPLASEAKLWPGPWYKRACYMLRSDMTAAGIPYKTCEGYFDFHSFRGQYITELASVTHNIKVLQTLARHADVRLTLHRYAKARPAEIMAATAALPVPMLK
ncbi:MAG: site-specific integrase [Planctomycetia bacterium]|nr:site-specific integrase [Planctomycetia bacterium]